MNKRDAYEILGVNRSEAQENIKKSYRKLALKYHPDRNPGDKQAEENFKEAAEAYSILGDPEKRASYDRFGYDGLRNEGFGGFSGFNSTIFADFEDILGDFFSFGFGDIFGSRSRRTASGAVRGRDLVLELDLTLEEAASGVTKEIKLNRAKHCELCRGSGMQPGTQKSTCSQCQGRGQVRYQQGFFAIARNCSQCGGSGTIISNPCESCHGSGKEKEKKSLKLNIPAGIDSGMRLRVEGEGDAGDSGGPAGDLYVSVKVKKHKFFEREHDDLLCQADISFARAALGAKLEIPTLEGKEILHIPSGTQTGDVLRLKGKGIQNINNHKKGDLFIHIHVETPRNMTKKQKEILRMFAESRGENIEDMSIDTIRKAKNIFH